MTDHTEARNNMVECQIKPNGVHSERILNVFRNMPRETFLPEEKQDIAYVDEDIRLGGTSFLMEPMIHARMLQAVNPKSDDIALVVNDCTGYASAVLSELVTTVVALESEDTNLEDAKGQLNALECNNVAVFESPVSEGYEKHGPYNIIFIHGAVSKIPESLLKQLTIGGQLVTVTKPKPNDFGSVTLVQRIGDDEFSTGKLFDAASYYVRGLEPVVEFQF